MKAKKWNIIRDSGLTILMLTISTFVGVIFQHLELHKTNVVVVYIFSILLISRFTKGYLYGIASSVASILLFNWFFTEPYFTFKVDDMTYFITFAIMMIISIMTSALTTKVKKAAEEARIRENESNALYQMTNHLTDSENTEEIAQITVKSVGEVLDCSVAFICFDEKGIPENTFVQRKKDGNIIRRKIEDANELRCRMEQLHGQVDITKDEYIYPIYGKSVILAVMRIPVDIGSTMSQSQTRMLHAIIESVALALERLRSLQEQAKSQEETAQERYRGNLLRAISHDIRTPLSGIMGTSEMLMDATDKEDVRYGQAMDIYKDAQWLYAMVENILNLTKIQDGRLSLNKQPEAVEEVIGATLMVVEKRFPERIIDVEMPDNVVMAPMDARLISQVLINLLDNADKYTPKNKKISITVQADEEWVNITVSDNGNGIAERDLPHIFQMFYTTSGKSPDSRRGVGLGLAICQSIVEAHGGKIKAENRKEGGASFTFTLPTREETV